MDEAKGKLRHHVLLVDDDESVAHASRDCLEFLGFSVEVFTDSRLAWGRFLEAPELFDLVVTDQVMPGLSGLELADRVHRRRPGLPVVLCTGFCANASSEAVSSAGLAALLFKPVFLDTLEGTLRRALGRTFRRVHA